MSRNRRFQAWNFDLATPSWRRTEQWSNRWPPDGERDRAKVHGVWGRGFLPSGRLLEKDELLQFAGYQAPQQWLSRTLTLLAGID